MKNFGKIICLVLLITLFASCSEVVCTESNSCNGKIVEKITESHMSTTVYFTDGSYYHVYSLNSGVIVSEYNK